MSDPRHALVRDVFLGACERPRDERAGYLGRQCGNDDGLRREVEALLRRHDEVERASGSTASADPRRFRPGELFADRYRIVSLLGEGGMGQVYRAEDETLGVPVAVKILPEDRAGRGDLLAEVRHAREVTHPAVCRVHDAGTWQGLLFITMEYVAGEDLASLLRRIGRMPAGKVLDIACQLCAGLAAAHARGVLHRDLKPANVLIDPEGHVRIADFGIAVGRREARQRRARAGTPAYMAPELFLTPRGASERSDLYSLGLVLYELATGRLPFEVEEGKSPSRRSRRWTPTPPSRFATGLDPDLERAILWCLSPDPEERPASALALAAALPGADPLALAAEARVTPPPEIVAAAVGRKPPAPGLLWAALAGLVLLLVAALMLGDETSVLERSGIAQAPEVLAAKAREIMAALGHPAKLGAGEYGYLDDPSPTSSEGSVLFWYRQESERLLPEATRRYLYARPFQPEPEVPGRTLVLLDQAGRLVYFQADPVESSVPADGDRSGEIAWQSAVGVTGIDPATVEEAPIGIAPVFADNRAAWLARDWAGEEVRLEAATAAGRVVYLAMTRPDEDWAEIAGERASYGERASWVGLFILLVAAVALPVAFLNLRRKRGDRRGARRLVLFVLGTLVAAWILRLGWVSHPMDEVPDVVVRYLGTLVLQCGWLWVGYLALEPWVRRSWPQVLVAWSRLLGGRWRDQLVGHSVLLGLLTGAALSAVGLLNYLIPRWRGLEDPFTPAASVWLESSLSTPLLFSTALSTVPRAIYDGMVTLLILVLLRWLLRGPRLGNAAFVVVYSLLVTFTSGGDPLTAWLVVGLPNAALATLLLVRFGFVAYISARFVLYLLFSVPLTTNAALWYSRGAFFAAGLVVVVGVSALWVALSGPATRRQPSAAA